jgi:hypothetical protein
MRNRFYLQRLAAACAVITGLLFLGCNMDILNGLRNPEELFAQKGGVVIQNLSNTRTIQNVEIKKATGETVTVDKDMLLTAGEVSNIGPQLSLGLALDPGTYTFKVTYPDGGTQPPEKTITVEWKKITEWYVFSDPIGSDSDIGMLQVINFSGEDVESVKVGAVGGDEDEFLNPPPLADKHSYSASRDPGAYGVEVKLASKEAFPKQDITIEKGKVTNIVVFENRIEVGFSDTGDNLWVLNRCSSEQITAVKTKKTTEAAYTSFPAGKLPILSGAYAQTRLTPSTYDVEVTVDGYTPPVTKSKILIEDPVFLIVSIGPNGPEIEVVKGGDSDGDGFPDWWEEKYFGEDAVTDSNLPDPDGDEDGDGLSNRNEYTYGTDPTNPDTDSDGLSDWEEINGKKDPNVTFPKDRPSNFPSTFPPTDPLKWDTDGDTFTDYSEVINNSDPTDPNSVPPNRATIVIPISWGN